MPIFEGNDRNNIIEGSSVGDLIEGYGGDDQLYGRDGNDTIRGGEGDDKVLGEDGDDALSGQGGRNMLDGGAGADEFYYAGQDRGLDSIDGGSGQDEVTLFFETFTTGVTFVMTDAASPTAVQGNGTTVVNVEAVTFEGSQGGDRVETLGGEDDLAGQGGADMLKGGGARDFIYGQQGHDQLFGENGRDFVLGGQGRDVIDGGRGSDDLFGGTTGGGRLDDAADVFQFQGDFGNDKVSEFQDGSDRLLFVGYTEDDLTVSRSGDTVRLALDNGIDAGTVTIKDFSGSFNARDYDFA